MSEVGVSVRRQPLLLIGPSEALGAPTPQLSVAVARPKARSRSAALGLQPKVRVLPEALITGAVVSSVQVTVRATGVAALPQASLTVQVRVWERWQPLLLIGPSEALGAPTPQLSVAVARPRARSRSAALGLQLKVRVLPEALITGAVVSSVQVTVRATGVAALPQASLTVQVRVWER